MTLNEIRRLLNADVPLDVGSLDAEIHTAFASDLMSDTLAYADHCTVLLTGLCNTQVLRTAEMLDMHCIIFVRGKTPAEEVLTLAREKGIAVISTQRGMFTASGLLYGAGLRGV